MKITIKSENGQKVVDLKNDLQFNAAKGEQYVFSNGFSNYVLNFKDNQESVILTFNVDGKSIKVELNGIVPLLQANTENMFNPTAIIINKDTNEKDVDNIVDNNSFDGGEIIDRLEALISKPVELGNNANSNLTMITDYQTLLESLGAAAAGPDAGGNGSNGSTFNSIFSLTDGGLNGIADTARWENLSETISTIPVETANTPNIQNAVTRPTATLTLNDVSVNEGTGIATIGGSLDYAPQTALTVTLSNGATITFGTDYVAGTVVQSTPFIVQDDDVYKDGETYTISVIGTTGGNFENLLTTDISTVTITDDVDVVKVVLTATTTTSEDGGSIVYTATLTNVDGLAVVAKEPVVVTLANGETITIPVGAKTADSSAVEVNRDDVYKETDSISNAIKTVTGGTSFESLVADTSTVTTTITDDVDVVKVVLTATTTTPKIIDINTTTNGTAGVKITGYNSDKQEVDLSIISGTNHDGFGIDGKNLSNGDTKELGVGEKIVVEFTDGKDVNSLDVSFAWRNNHETAKLTFIKDGQVVGYATVDGDGSSTTNAIVKYYDKNNNLIKKQEAEGSSDRVDKAFTFELPDSNGGIVSFDKVEFSAPQNKDDYLINKIVYKEVLNPEVTDIVTNGGDITFNIQVDENYPPQGTATAIVEVNGKEYSVELNSTGRGTLTIDSKELGDLSNIIAKVTEVKGGNYEKVNPTEEVSFNFTPTLKSTDDNISTDEDVAYTLKVTDFGEVSSNTKEFKITELPTNGKLFLNITKGETIFNPDGTKTEATQDSRVEITKGQIVTLGQVGAGKVEFVPNPNSDEDGSFKFQVGDGNGKFSEEYTTTIDIKAVADAPTVSIDVTKVGATTISTGNSGNGNSGSNTKIEKLAFEEYKFAQEPSNATVINKNDSNYTNANAGNDTIKFTGTFNNGNTVNTGAGDDYVYFNQTSNVTLNLGEGNNQAHFNQEMKGSIKASSGNDEVRINQSINKADIDLGAGNNKLYIKNISNGNNGEIKFGDGSDKLVIDGSADNTNISLGRGNNIVSIKGNYGGTITSEDGNDTIIIGGNINNQNSKINTGAGKDFVQIHGEINNQFGKVDLGEGDDGFRYESTNWNAGNQNAIDGGKGFDTLYLKGNSTDYYVYTKDENIGKEYGKLHVNGGGIYMISWETYAKLNEDNEGYAKKEFYITKNYYNTNMALKVTNFESISFDDKTIGEKVDTTTVYKYDIKVSAKLTDTDGSEKLSDVTLKNIPENSKLYGSDGNEINANDDGSYTVKVDANGEAKLTLTNEKELSDTELNSIQTSVTSTDTPTDGNEESSHSTTFAFAGEGDIDLTSLINNNTTYKTVADVIDMTNNKVNTLHIDMNDVVDLVDDDKHLVIKGDLGDKVDLDTPNDWANSGKEQLDGVNYKVFTGTGVNSTIKLLIEDEIVITHDI